MRFSERIIIRLPALRLRECLLPQVQGTDFVDDVITYFTINKSIEDVRSSSSGGCRERASNEAVRLQGFVQTIVSLCPDEALMKSERLRPELNLQNNGLTVPLC